MVISYYFKAVFLKFLEYVSEVYSFSQRYYNGAKLIEDEIKPCEFCNMVVKSLFSCQHCKVSKACSLCTVFPDIHCPPCGVLNNLEE